MLAGEKRAAENVVGREVVWEGRLAETKASFVARLLSTVLAIAYHSVGQANLSVSVAMLGITTSRLADGAVQAMM